MYSVCSGFRSGKFMKLLPQSGQIQKLLHSDFSEQLELHSEERQVLLICKDHAIRGNYDKVLTLTKPLLDVLWERLNTGHWSQVPELRRKEYALTCLLRGLAFAELDMHVKSLLAFDRGILMGAPIGDNLLAELAEQLHAVIAAENATSADADSTAHQADGVSCAEDVLQLTGLTDKPVCRLSAPSMSSFSEFLDKKEPVVLTGCLQHWPALEKWSVDYVKKVAGYRTVPIEVGQKYSDENWGQRLMTVNEFVDTFLRTRASVPGYLAQHPLFDQVKALADDICTPDYCALSPNGDVEVNAWFGPSGTVSPFHYDPRDNLLVQVFGRKQILLASPADSDGLYPHSDKMLFNTARFDPGTSDLDLYPLAKEVTFWTCILGPGEMLFMPQKWWHYVKALDVSFSVNFWFC